MTLASRQRRVAKRNLGHRGILQNALPQVLERCEVGFRANVATDEQPQLLAVKVLHRVRAACGYRAKGHCRGVCECVLQRRCGISTGLDSSLSVV